jgi:Domain of unknown function (DUF222)/HNH endonuclease
MAVTAVADPVTEPVTGIEDRLREICGHLNVLHAQLVEVAAEALETGCWQGWGVRSLTHWLTWQAGISRARATELVRLAEARSTHPKVMETFAEGALSVDQAAIATKAPAYLDREFADLAQAATVDQLRVAVRAARPAAPAPPPADEPAESFTGSFDDDGRFHMRGELDPDHGRLVDAALGEARDALFQRGQTDVSWADAFVEMAQRSMDTASPERRERFRVNWFLDPGADIPATWSDRIAIPDWLREHLLCDGTVSPVFTAAGRPVSVGTTQHAIPERTRRLVLHRDVKCRVPWCNQTRWLEVHHIVHREDGGDNHTSNLVGLCPGDHRLHHKGQLGITGDADDPNGLVFTDASGRVIDPAAHPAKPTGPPPAPARPYQHPLGERLYRRWLFFPDPPTPPPPETGN